MHVSSGVNAKSCRLIFIIFPMAIKSEMIGSIQSQQTGRSANRDTSARDKDINQKPET